MVGVTADQVARINVLAPSINPPDPDRPERACLVTLRVFDAEGRLVADSEGLEVPTGQARSFEFPVPPGTDGRAQLRAVVLSANPPEPDMPAGGPCPVVSTLEVYDAATGRTTILAAPAINPPEPD